MSFLYSNKFFNILRASFPKNILPMTHFHSIRFAYLWGESPYSLKNCKNFHHSATFSPNHMKSSSSTNASSMKLDSISYLGELEKTKDVVRADVIQNDAKIGDLADWSAKVFDYNVPHGKKIRGTMVIKTYHALMMKEESLNFTSASILGWCVELLQAFFLICDDIMDQSSIRRGRPCWYKNPGVGFCAINDSLILWHSIFRILSNHLHSSPNYHNIVELLIQMSEKTVSGQSLDLLSHPNNSRPKFEIFGIKRYQAIVQNKSSFYTYCLPIHLAMYLAGKTSRHLLDATKELSLKLGYLFQMQDDMLDCFGDPEVIGKVGTDIQEGKCTWLSAMLFDTASDSIKREMMEIYGINREDYVHRVKQIYKNLSLESRFLETQDELCIEIFSMIGNLEDDNLKVLFSNLANELYKREK